MAQAESSEEGRSFARHGGRLDDAIRVYPHAPQPWIDLSTGINPVPWQAPEGLTTDPAPLPTTAALKQLEVTAARYFGVDPATVAAMPGSEVALRLLPALGLPVPLVAAVPTYGTHEAVAEETIDRAAIAAPRAGTIVIANPNNPDGVTLSPTVLHAAAARQAEFGGQLVIDEAFADVTPDASVLGRWDQVTPLIVTRSFGKFFGLAGVRLGFVIAAEPVIGRLRQMLGDWPVSAQAIAWGQAAYADYDWIVATRTALVERAARLDALLARHGLAATGGCPLFRLVEDRNAQSIFDRLARAGILTRPFAYRADWLRFGLPGDDDAFDRLDRALADG